MRTRFVVGCLFALMLAVSLPISGASATTCKDGTHSNSSGRGTCSHHGGVADDGDDDDDSSSGDDSDSTPTPPSTSEPSTPQSTPVPSSPNIANPAPAADHPVVDWHTYDRAYPAFADYWNRYGGLSVFGYAKTRWYVASNGHISQIFERNRMELHLENQPPYNVQLGILGEERLIQLGRIWQNEPKGEAQNGCRYFAETGHNLCGSFLAYWQSHGLEFDGKRGFSEAESLALLGYPITEATAETGADGMSRTTQWFQRARFEDHEADGVQLGLLGNEVYGQQ